MDQGLKGTVMRIQQSIGTWLTQDSPPGGATDDMGDEIRRKAVQAPSTRPTEHHTDDHRRHLHQTATSTTTSTSIEDQVTVVAKAQELKEAVVAGVANIEIQQHMDVTGLDLVPAEGLLGAVPATLRSIRGNCPSDVPESLTQLMDSSHASLRPLVPFQCVLFTDEQLFMLHEGRLWLDGVYVRLTMPRSTVFGGFIEIWGSSAKLWMTGVTLQGHGNGERDCQNCGLEVGGYSAVYVQDCIFADFDGETVIGVYSGVTSSFVRCQFANNTIFEHAYGAGVIQANAGDEFGDSEVRLQECDFLGNTPQSKPVLLADNKDADLYQAIFYSDSAKPAVCLLDAPGATSVTGLDCNTSSPLSLAAAGTRFLAADDAWIKSVQQGLPTISRGFLPLPDLIPSTSASAISAPATTPAAAAASSEQSDQGQGQPMPPTLAGDPVAPPSSLSATDPAVAPVDTTSIDPAANGDPSLRDFEITREGPDNEGEQTMHIVAGVSASLVVMILLVVAVVVCRFLRRVRSAHAYGKGNVTPHACMRKSGPGAKHVARPKSDSSTFMSLDTIASKQAALVPVTGAGTLEATGVTTQSMGNNTTLASVLSDIVPPPEGASDRERKDYLQYQLDTMTGGEVLGGWVFQDGVGSQACGGQAVVRFATSRTTRQEAAIKFFLCGAAFGGEIRLYTDDTDTSCAPLRQFLPPCYDVMHTGDPRLVDGNCRQLPPCIVMEKGESLDRWVQRNNRGMDQFTCMQIIHHICECLLDLHAAGYVHRDLKPANIMWLPSQNRWTLIDFGCVARTGTTAPTGFTLAYAAPEAVHACYRAGADTLVATEALDAWSVGVLAVELFTGRPALVQFVEGKEKVIEMILGEDKLPWEGDARAKELLRRAGRFKDAVLGLLCRDPAQRVSVQTFVQQYASILSTTTQQAGAAAGDAVRGNEAGVLVGDDADEHNSNLNSNAVGLDSGEVEGQEMGSM